MKRNILQMEIDKLRKALSGACEFIEAEVDGCPSKYFEIDELMDDTLQCYESNCEVVKRCWREFFLFYRLKGARRTEVASVPCRSILARGRVQLGNIEMLRVDWLPG